MNKSYEAKRFHKAYLKTYLKSKIAGVLEEKVNLKWILLCISIIKIISKIQNYFLFVWSTVLARNIIHKSHKN